LINMNALQQLIHDWVTAEKGRSVRSLAEASDLPASTVAAITARDTPAAMPRLENLRKLARGLGLPYQTVADAAAKAAGLRIEELTPDQQKYRAWVALLDDLPPEEEERLWDIGVTFLRRVQERK
jgi:transcriptional regulator with XRE-family HTH domain